MPADCLKEVMKGGAILCPTCRKPTTVPGNDINNLVVNFMLQEFAGHLKELHSNKALMCQLCLVDCALLKCQECIQLLCEDCSLKLNKVKTFKEHKLFKLCHKHKEGMITHLCMKFVQPSCSKCVMMEHLDHEADIEMFDEGTKLIKENITQYEAYIEVRARVIRKWKVEDDQKLVERTLKEQSVKLKISENFITKGKGSRRCSGNSLQKQRKGKRRTEGI